MSLQILFKKNPHTAYLKELIQALSDKVNEQESTLQEFSRQVTTNSALLHQVKSSSTDTVVTPAQNAL